MTNAPLPLLDDDHRDRRKPKHVVIGITGGIAAYKTAELVRLFVKAGISVTAVMTDAAQKFVTPTTLQALSGNKVFVDLWDDEFQNGMAHIELSRGADMILVAPATANFLAKLTAGIADDLLSTLCLARNAGTCPLLVAPAMNREMWDNPATQRNVAQIKADGIVVLGPAAGEQACGETGEGRMLEAAELFKLAVHDYARRHRLQGNLDIGSPFASRTVVVTAGSTFEAIDPVRGITNTSSGKMGYAIAAALRDAGAEVILISGPTALNAPDGVKLTKITSSSQMLAAVEAVIDSADAFFSVAAVADYAPATPQTRKIKKTDANLSLALAPTVDILAMVARRPSPPFCVGFAAESHNVVENASKKRLNKQIPMIIANHANTAIGADDNEVVIIDANGAHPIVRATKAEIASKIVAHASLLFAVLVAGGGIAAQANPISSIKQSKHVASNS